MKSSTEISNIPSAFAMFKSIRISPRKLNLVASFIRNMNASDAIVQLKFSHKRVAKDVLKCLESAIANAENNFGLDIDCLVVSEATVGKAFVMKRFTPRARGRASKIRKFVSNLRIKVTELKER